MPRPVFIICSDSGCEDNTTRRLSIFDVIEKIVAKKVIVKGGTSKPSDVPMQPLPKPNIYIRVTSVWMQTDESESGREYESEFVLHMPPDNRIKVVAQATFNFGDMQAPFKRFILNASGAPFGGSGLLRIEHRIRKVGEESWLSQDSPILVDQETIETSMEGLSKLELDGMPLFFPPQQSLPTSVPHAPPSAD